MKIAVLGTRGFPNIQGGVEAHCENLYPQLVEMGCEVIVFTRKPYMEMNKDSYKGVTLISLSCPRNKYLEALVHTLYGVFEASKINPDILHIHAIGPSLLVPLARLLGLKVVMTNHGPEYQREKWKRSAKFILKLGEKVGSCWANAIVCISEQIAEDIKRKYNRVSKVIPNGVIMPEVLESDNALKEYGLVKGEYVLSVGRLVPEKGFHDLIEAFTDLKLDRWKLVIVGGADHEDKYSLGLKEKALARKNIVLTGFLTGKPLQELYSHAGLFVLPSYYEGLPIALLEAMSFGLSCIASDIPANRNIMLDKSRYFEIKNPSKLSRKMKEYIGSPLSIEEKIKQKNILAEKYDWRSIAAMTLEIYIEIGSTSSQ